ncbi:MULTISPECIES: YihY/virulence factor BrkB family protein [Cryobacterium]|uniref:YihY/virulence factor BrkB family protein n=1 Tax=Cryobacterium breve TaxID=1259258 RepID=A0ABY2J7T8_9MICO|nr:MULTISPECIES: YihY/virulence factor BrkB family protein [Cryobacterium]TFC92127.1 YihY/virulence factor BrkB family protein [Cryobacterium sp. TmT3-12]TFC99733.1 YihY/virulence factor BrkB family protein [Cryobacterium breve]
MNTPAVVDRTKTLVARIMRSRPVRVLTRFGDSGGSILAGGMSYQAIFATFAALWLTFSIAGLWITSNPDLEFTLYSFINQSVPGLIGEEGVIDPSVLASARVFGWSGVIALVGLLATVLGWLSTTALAVRTIFRMPPDKTFILLVKLRELGLGLLFAVVLVVSALISIASTEALGALFGLFGVSRDSFWFNTAARTLGLILVLVIDTVTLAALFRVLSRVRIPFRQLITGSVLGAAGLGVLKILGSTLLAGAGRNPLLAAFAVIIGLLIWFNLTSTLTLLAASWIAVGMDDAGLSPRQISADEVAIEKRLREEEAFQVVVRAELRDARLAHDAATWPQRLLTARRLRAAEKRAAAIDADGPG